MWVIPGAVGQALRWVGYTLGRWGHVPSEGAATGGPQAGGRARPAAATGLLSSSAVMSTVVTTLVAGEGCSWPSVTAETWGHTSARCLAPAPTAPALSHSQHHDGPMAKSLGGEEEVPWDLPWGRSPKRAPEPHQGAPGPT